MPDEVRHSPYARCDARLAPMEDRAGVAEHRHRLGAAIVPATGG